MGMGALYRGVTAIAFAAALAISSRGVGAQPATDPAIRVGERDLGGVVSGPDGPEGGVWVIAETTDLPTKFAKIVVTDDRGRYLIPDLPKANYSVWVRGYGLVDSQKVASAPGKILNLSAAEAPNEAAAAQFYPPIYWFSLLRVPEKSEFPLPKIKSQGEWLNMEVERPLADAPNFAFAGVVDGRAMTSTVRMRCWNIPNRERISAQPLSPSTKELGAPLFE